MADIDSKIDEILKPLVEELRSWVDSELGGTSFHGDAIKAIDEDTSTVKSAIKNLLLEAQIAENKRMQVGKLNLSRLTTDHAEGYNMCAIDLNMRIHDRIAALQKELE